MSTPRTRTPKNPIASRQRAEAERAWLREKAGKLTTLRKRRAFQQQALAANPTQEVWTPARQYREIPAITEAVDTLHRALERDLQILFYMLKKLPEDAVENHPHLIRQITGVKIGIRSKIPRIEREIGIPGLSRPFFAMFVYGYAEWERYDSMRVALFHRSQKYRKWARWYKATPERVASVKAAQARHDASPQRAAYRASEQGKSVAAAYESSAERKAAAALRKRMAYYNVNDPKDLPQKSTKGRKSTPKKVEV